jgi:chromosome segregation ATPase
MANEDAVIELAAMHSRLAALETRLADVQAAVQDRDKELSQASARVHDLQVRLSQQDEVRAIQVILKTATVW